MRHRSRLKKGSVTLAGLIIAAVIICFVVLRTYFRRPVFDKATDEYFAQQGVDTSSYTSILNGTLKKVEGYEKLMSSGESKMWERYQGEIE
ncbi:MAG: hypothetical protein WC552_08795 [Candidatus Omnitrophota bacterium]